MAKKRASRKSKKLPPSVRLSPVEFRKKIHPIAKRIKSLATAEQFRFGKGTLFLCLANAAFSRAVGYLELCSSERDKGNLFFSMGSLRAIAEDIIYLKYFQKLPKNEQEEAITFFMHFDLKRMTDAQQVFLGNNKRFAFPTPQIPTPTPASDAVRALKRKKIFDVAAEVGLQDFYAYMYQATSRMVHFSPSMLFRTGWGTLEPKASGEMGDVTFSTDHFSGYYDQFCAFYAAYLLRLLFIAVGSEIPYAEQLNLDFKRIHRAIILCGRWPEAVTLEEMNIKLDQSKYPGFLYSALEHVMIDEELKKEGLESIR